MPAAGGAAEVTMPVGKAKAKPRRTEKLQSHSTPVLPPPPHERGTQRSWEELEATKMRALDALSRVEYLGSSQSRFYDFRRSEHKDLEYAVRTARTLPGHGNDANMSKLRVAKIMNSSPSNAAELLSQQKNFLQTSPKSKKRMDMVNRFVEDSESKRSGAKGAEAAKKSASGNTLEQAQMPDYAEVIAAPQYSTGHQPMMSVKLMPYVVPESALKHGMSKTLPSLSSTAGKTM